MKSLGFANSWDKLPEELEKCIEKKHFILIEKIGKCLTRYTCKECQISYVIDSGE